MTSCGTDAAVSFDVTIDVSAVPAAEFVEAFYATGSPGSMPIATPDILAGTASTPDRAMLWSGHFLGEAGVHGRLLGFGLRSTSAFDHPMYVGAVALDRAGVAAGAWSGPIDDPENAALELALDPALRSERWGTSAGGACFRLNLGSATVFITRDNDADCDGLVDPEDAQPYAFCDPAATSARERDACQQAKLGPR